MADREGVDIRYYSVIYAAIDEIEAALKGLLKPIYEEANLGQAEIREIFRSSRAGIIAGCMVIDGTMRRNAKARLLREGVVIADTRIGSLRREKDDVTEVREGFECGITLAQLLRHPDRRRHRDVRDARKGAFVDWVGWSGGGRSYRFPPSTEVAARFRPWQAGYRPRCNTRPHPEPVRPTPPSTQSRLLRPTGSMTAPIRMAEYLLERT